MLAETSCLLNVLRGRESLQDRIRVDIGQSCIQLYAIGEGYRVLRRLEGSKLPVG